MMAEPKTVAIVFTHMGHPLFPGQPLHPLCGKPLIAHAVERLQYVSGIEEIWLVSPYQPVNEPLLLWGLRQNHFTLAYSGESDDWVGQVDAVLEKSKATRFVTIFADFYPFVDVAGVAKLISALDEHPDWLGAIAATNPAWAWDTGNMALTDTGWKACKKACLTHKPLRHPVVCVQDALADTELGRLEARDTEEALLPSIQTSMDVHRYEIVLQSLLPNDPVLSPQDLADKIKFSHEDLTKPTEFITASGDTPRVLFAVQAGGDFGTGHLARCRTLKQTIESQYDLPVSMWMDSPSQQYRDECASADDNLVDSHWSLPETLKKSAFSHVVIDFQTPVTPSLIQGIRHVRPDIPVIIMDNEGLGCLEADALIYPNAHSEPSRTLLSSPVKVYYGSQYVILGSGFLSEMETSPETSAIHQPSVLISAGGRDPEHISERVLDSLKDLKDCHIDLVVPMMYDQPENLERLATHMPSTVTLHWRIKNLRPLMQRTTVAICAFGVTAYELAYLGVPTILLGHYEYQEAERQRFASWGSAINLGWGKTVQGDKLRDTVATLLSDATVRQRMHEAGQKLVDTQGAQRVIDVVLSTSRRLSRV